MTYTVVILEVSQSAYDEIAEKLRAASYDQAFMSDGGIDMTHIAIKPEPELHLVPTFDRRGKIRKVDRGCKTPQTCDTCHECQRPQPCPKHQRPK